MGPSVWPAGQPTAVTLAGTPSQQLHFRSSSYRQEKASKVRSDPGGRQRMGQPLGRKQHEGVHSRDTLGKT